MPSLEILDISRNKIRKLPPTPGTLVRLKVFSIAKNRVKRLPVWFTAMTQLKVLKLDHNPLDWPPRDISTFPGTADGQTLSKQEEAEEMQRWLPMLMRWMRENRERELERERDRDNDRRRVAHECVRLHFVLPGTRADHICTALGTASRSISSHQHRRNGQVKAKIRPSRTKAKIRPSRTRVGQQVSLRMASSPFSPSTRTLPLGTVAAAPFRRPNSPFRRRGQVCERKSRCRTCGRVMPRSWRSGEPEPRSRINRRSPTFQQGTSHCGR
jgi:hypothetical protein